MNKIFISDIKWSYLFSYFGKSDSLFRYYQDLVIESTSSDFEGDIIELGGEKKYNTQRFFKKNKLIVSNISRDFDTYINITAIPFGNNEIDNYIMVSMLQHVDEPFVAINEVKRTLKPGGKILIINAFSHPICDEKDYWRFGEDAYHSFFKEEFEIIKIFYLGGKFSMISNTLRRPIGSLKGKYFVFKIIGVIISVLAKAVDRQDAMPIGIGMLVKKKI
ncbi:MAG: methyltransferase domain-containing protein [Flavobacterium sp.]|uniref:class I SAM-dependent methyltransferase n=1 Tax=Flavobacterium sp. TaxID=239 RepID=UPI0032648918